MCHLDFCVAGQAVEFTTSYAKKKVSVRINHSVTFAWKFSGVVDKMTWGFANVVATQIEEKLVALNGSGIDVLQPVLVPEAYKGRVNGTRTGDSSSGQARFTLYNVSKDDTGFYGCLLTPDNPNLDPIADFVQLVVVGMYLFRDL